MAKGVDFVLSCFDLMQGGEIFVPKIPSMKMTDLAAVLAPDCKKEIIGIRPGEKLHETMITADDARYTLEIPDRYIIRPPKFHGDHSYHGEQKALPEGFNYASDNNSEWLQPDELREILSRY